MTSRPAAVRDATPASIARVRVESRAQLGLHARERVGVSRAKSEALGEGAPTNRRRARARVRRSQDATLASA